jgi:hypothetical protein
MAVLEVIDWTKFHVDRFLCKDNERCEFEVTKLVNRT